MNNLLETALEQSKLLNRLILDFNTTETVGRVKQLWLDAKSHQVTGLTCASGLLGREKHSFYWDKIQNIGKDSILVNVEEQEKVEQPELIDNVIGLEVWTDAGNKAGKLVDYCVDTKTGAVVAYLFTSSGWRGITDGTYLLYPDAVINVGNKRVIVADASIQNAQQYDRSLNEKIQHAKEFIQEDYAKSQEDFTVAVQTTQGVASRFQEKAQQATGVAKEKLSDAANQLQKAAKEVSTQAQEKLAEFKTKATEKKDSLEEIASELKLSNANSEFEQLEDVSEFKQTN